MAITYYLGDGTESIPGVTGSVVMGERAIIDATTTYATVTSGNVAGGTTYQDYWAIQLGDTVEQAAAGTWTVEVYVDVGNGAIFASVRVGRMPNNGTDPTDATWTAYTAEQDYTTSLLTFVTASTDLGTWAAGDWLVVNIQHRGNHPHGNEQFTLGFNDTDVEVITPLDPASGNVSATGTATFTFGSTASATRDTSATGAQSTTFGSTGTATRETTGTASSSFVYSGTATGTAYTDVTATGASSFTYSGTATAGRTVTATASSSATYSGTGAATRTVSATGTASTVFSAAGTATRATTATAASSFVFTAAATGTAAAPGWGAPQNLVATPNGSDKVDLTWDAVVGADWYRVERDGSIVSPYGSPTLTSYQDSGLQASTTYVYRVRAVQEPD